MMHIENMTEFHSWYFVHKIDVYTCNNNTLFNCRHLLKRQYQE